MSRIQNWFGFYFAGTYFHTLDKSNDGKLEYSSYFAILSIFIITTSNLMFALGLALTFGYPDGVFLSKFSNVAIVLGLFSLYWMYFVWRDRYKDIVRSWVESRSRAKRIGMGVNWFLFGGFAIMIVRLIVIM